MSALGQQAQIYTQGCAMNGPDFQEGLDSAHALITKCATLPGEEREQAIFEALLDLVDLPLGWNNLEPTRERLAGFASVLTDILQDAGKLQPESSHMQCCAAWRRLFSRIKAGRAPA